MLNSSFVTIEVSKDGGQTWENMTVDVWNINPETSPIKPGWLIRRDGTTRRVYLHTSKNQLKSEKVEV